MACKIITNQQGESGLLICFTKADVARITDKGQGGRKLVQVPDLGGLKLFVAFLEEAARDDLFEGFAARADEREEKEEMQ